MLSFEWNKEVLDFTQVPDMLSNHIKSKTFDYKRFNGFEDIFWKKPRHAGRQNDSGIFPVTLLWGS